MKAELNHVIDFMENVYLPLWYHSTIPLKALQVKDESDGSRISEHFVQALWNDGRFIRDQLTDDRGRTVKVIRSGTWNFEPGPDFLNALVEIDGHRLAGAVEIHLTPEEWNKHGHQYDPNYEKVILHVVWQPGTRGRIPPHLPLVSLEEQLCQPLDIIFAAITPSELVKTQIHPAAGCAEQMSRLSDDQLQLIFRSAGLSRLSRKTTQFTLSCTRWGFDQAFYFHLADALGFKNNRKAFRLLAAALPIQSLKEMNAGEREAAFWGYAGLLPDNTRENIQRSLLNYSRKMWKHWWRLRNGNERVINWNRSTLRPLNSPERRLAALVGFINLYQASPVNFIEEVESLIDYPAALKKMLMERFDFDSHWKEYYSFVSKASTPSRLIGKERLNDIIVNVILPALSARAGENQDQLKRIYNFYMTLPKGQNNHCLEIARHRFFLPPARMKQIIRKAVDQQGVLQLHLDFEIPETPQGIVEFWAEFGLNVDGTRLVS